MQHDITIPQVDYTKNSGLRGYYFSDDAFTALSYIAESHTGELATGLPEAVRSIYWCGYLRPDKSGEFHFSTGDAVHTQVTVNGKYVLGAQLGVADIFLDKDMLYHLEVRCVRQPWQADVWLGCCPVTLTEKQQVSGVNLVLPDGEASALALFGAPVFSAQEKTDLALKTGVGFSPTAIDPLNKGIPVDWQISGYTVEYENQDSRGKKKIVKWDEHKHQNKEAYSQGPQYVKYTSNPEVLSTVGDPYSDYDKVMGKCGDDVSPRVNHPWVAAWPEVILEVAAFSIHEKDNIGGSTGKAAAKYNSTKKTTGTITDSKHAVGITLSGGFEGKKPKGELSASYNYNWGTSKYDLTESESGSNESTEAGTSISYDTSSKAATYASVRFINVGTASVYKFEPTINMRLTPGEIGGKKYDYDDITTVATASNPSQAASDITYGGVFPSVDTTVMLYQLNDKNAAGIMLNETQYQQFLALQNFETSISSFAGNYMLKPGDYRPFVDYKSSINERCVKVTWCIPANPNGGKGRGKGYNHQVVRYLYAKENNLTIGKIMELTPELTRKDNKFTFHASRDMKGMTSTFYELSVQINTRRDLNISIDEYCTRELGSSRTLDNIYQMKLTPELEVILSPKGYTALNTGKETLEFCYGADANFVYGSHVLTRPDIDGADSKKTYRHLFDSEGKLNNKPGWQEYSTETREVKAKNNIRTYITKAIKKLYYNEYIDVKDKTKGCQLYTGLLKDASLFNKQYYFNDEGMLVTGWFTRKEKPGVSYGVIKYESLKQKQVDEKGKVSYQTEFVERMYPGESGVLEPNTIATIAQLKNNKLETYSYHFVPDKEGVLVRADGFATINGVRYYFKDEQFDKDQYGWNSIPADYPAGAMIAGSKNTSIWFSVGGKVYYVDHVGKIACGNHFINSSDYFLTKDTGELLFYTHSHNSRWRRGYYADGKLISDKVVRDGDGNGYYFNSDGWCELGWITCPTNKDKWAFSSRYHRPCGKLFKGWSDFNGDGSKWYYFGTGSDNTGLLEFEMATGLIKIGNEYYYFTSSGVAGKNNNEYATKIIYMNRCVYIKTNEKGLVVSGAIYVILDLGYIIDYKLIYVDLKKLPL